MNSLQPACLRSVAAVSPVLSCPACVEGTDYGPRLQRRLGGALPSFPYARLVPADFPIYVYFICTAR